MGMFGKEVQRWSSPMLESMYAKPSYKFKHHSNTHNACAVLDDNM